MREHEAFTSHIFVPRGHHEALTTGARTQSDILSTDRDHYSRTLSVFLRRSLVVGVHPSRLLHCAFSFHPHYRSRLETMAASTQSAAAAQSQPSLSQHTPSLVSFLCVS